MKSQQYSIFPFWTVTPSRGACHATVKHFIFKLCVRRCYSFARINWMRIKILIAIDQCPREYTDLCTTHAPKPHSNCFSLALGRQGTYFESHFGFPESIAHFKAGKCHCPLFSPDADHEDDVRVSWSWNNHGHSTIGDHDVPLAASVPQAFSKNSSISFFRNAFYDEVSKSPSIRFEAALHIQFLQNKFHFTSNFRACLL